MNQLKNSIKRLRTLRREIFSIGVAAEMMPVFFLGLVVVASTLILESLVETCPLILVESSLGELHRSLVKNF